MKNDISSAERLEIFNKYSNLEKYIIASLKGVFQKIVATDGKRVEVKYTPTAYVANGGLFDGGRSACY